MRKSLPLTLVKYVKERQMHAGNAFRNGKCGLPFTEILKEGICQNETSAKCALYKYKAGIAMCGGSFYTVFLSLGYQCGLPVVETE